jgi:hypothetical protein
MDFKPTITLKKTMQGLAVLFGAFSATKLFVSHDLYTALWSFAVCFALVLGLLPPWLTGHTSVAHAVKPEKYNLTQ